ncbi:hypothetical protein Cni_G17930 [Canna indica]|uniref:Uncharacterized protein n=1 Tax=Canna indica TaxID=4628 RepID=A0AAQ3KIB0_9LILI|nr:hypothetical protein Cni_G17930 [Canna indica]
MCSVPLSSQRLKKEASFKIHSSLESSPAAAMLSTVEGRRRLFSPPSSPAHKRFLVLQLLGWRNQERPMKVSPLNQYQLVDKEASGDLQRDSPKPQNVRGLIFTLISFLCISVRRNGSSLRNSETSANNEGGEGEGKLCLKSSLKKSSSVSCAVLDPQAERKQVQWTDTYGKELVEIREFELSDEEEESEDEFLLGDERRCECIIQ